MSTRSVVSTLSLAWASASLSAGPVLTVNTQPTNAAVPLSLSAQPSLPPPNLPYAVVRLALDHPDEASLTPLRVTESGRVLLTLPNYWIWEEQQQSPVLGYRWHNGVLDALERPAAQSYPYPDDHLYYGHINGTGYSFLSDMNSSGTVIGGYTREDSSYYDWATSDTTYVTSGAVWHPGQSSSETLPYPVSPSPLFGGFTPQRITDSGAVYGYVLMRGGDPLYSYYLVLEDGLTWPSVTSPAVRLGANWPVDVALPAIDRRIIAASPNGAHVLSYATSVYFNAYPDPSNGDLIGAHFDPYRAHGSYERDGLAVTLPATSVPRAINNSGRWIWYESPTSGGIGFTGCWSDENDTRNIIGSASIMASAINNAHDILAAGQTWEIWKWLPKPDAETHHYVKHVITPTLPTGWAMEGIIPNLPDAGLLAGRIRQTHDIEGEPIPYGQQPSVPALFVPAELAVDTNHNGIINLARDTTKSVDSDRTSTTIPFRFWSNDDDDNPGATPEADYLNNVVDGEGDLLDFFPVFLDIKQLLTVLPPSATVKYKLKQADGGLNFVYTNLTRATAFSYQAGTLTTGFGPSFTQAASVATTQQITAAGVELPAAFLTNIKDSDQGVILVEARQVSGSPLKLVVEKDNVQIAEVALNIASLRLYADPGKVHLGFDPPNKSEGDAPNEYWASVVQGTTNTILNLDLPASALAGVEWKIAAADTSRVDISPKTFTSATTKLTITGLSTGATIPEPTSITLVPTGGNGVPILTLNVLVLPQREMSLAIYVLEDPNAPLTQFNNAPVVPLPAFDEILNICKESFKQAGVHFTLHPSSGNFPFPYDTRGLVQYSTGVYRYSETAPTRVCDGMVTNDEKIALVNFYESSPRAFDSIFPAASNAVDVIRIVLIKDSGLPYDSDNFAGPKARGFAGDPRDIALFVRNVNPHVGVAAAHEVGHVLSLAVANDDGGGHDDPPFPYSVMIDLPDNAAPSAPSDTRYPHKAQPNVALLQSGTPEAAGLPWPYGRWLRNEDWLRANRRAGGLPNE